ncbi:MAG: YicC/YloC family endoribonuclease [Desulfobacterales bacterium]|jgi:uncharacterized protein (TIGR00255 family)
MIRSMTGFARAESNQGTVAASVEIRTYNSRHLDPVVRLGHGFTGLEEKVKGQIAERIARGRVEVQIRIREAGEAAGAFEVDESLAAAYIEALNRLRVGFGLTGEPSLELVAKTGGIIKPAEVEKDIEALWPQISDCVASALDMLEEMRAREGGLLAEDFSRRLAFIESSIDRIADSAGDLLPVYLQRLTERIEALTQGLVEIEPGRITQEAAILADRSDISEEIVRARSHVVQFRETMDGPEPAGRKLNFLLQEFNREFNTMASKAASTEIAHVIVDVRAELEKLREQVQNVE